MTMGRVYACLRDYLKAESCSLKACQGFMRQMLERHGPEGAYSHDVTEKHIQDEIEKKPSEEDNQVLRNLAISFYTNSSHREKLDLIQESLESALEARRYQSRLPMSSYKESSFMQTIELKIDKLRTKLNNQQTVKHNRELIKKRAEQNIAKIRESQDKHQNTEIPPVSKTNKIRPSTAKDSAVGKAKLRPSSGLSGLTADKSNQISTVAASTRRKAQSKAKEKKEVILKKNYGELNNIVKDPETKKNLDSRDFRVTSLYLHNEYFHGNYSNGVQMYKSTSNNEKFYPYKALNPIPNDPNYKQRARPSIISAGHVRYEKKPATRDIACDDEAYDTIDDDIENLIADSFESNPNEVIELHSPKAHAKYMPDRPKSASERLKEFRLEHGHQPVGVGGFHGEKDEKESVEKYNTDKAKKQLRPKSRGNTPKD
jgi:hypothetical protein